MGNHRVGGTLKGLGRKNAPTINVTISGELDKDPRQEFKKELEKLGRGFGLSVKTSRVKKRRKVK